MLRTHFDRYVRRHLIKSGLSMCALFSGIILIAIAAPLLRNGAPIDAVLMSVPIQLGFALPISLLLGFSAATLLFVGKLRQSGEWIALRACGLHSGHLLRASLPLFFILAFALSLFEQFVMPGIMVHLRENKLQLARQGISNLVARKRPIYKNDANGVWISAGEAQHDELGHVFYIKDDPKGDLHIAYAPTAHWAFDEHLHLVCENLVSLSVNHNNYQSDYVRLPEFSYVIVDSKNDRLFTKPDTMSFTQLQKTISKKLQGDIKKERRSLARSLAVFWQRLLLPLSACALFIMCLALALYAPPMQAPIAALLALLMTFAAVYAGFLFVQNSSPRSFLSPLPLMLNTPIIMLILSSIMLWRRRS